MRSRKLRDLAETVGELAEHASDILASGQIERDPESILLAKLVGIALKGATAELVRAIRGVSN